MIFYEYPFNERLRTYLRLEHLLRRLDELVPRTHALDHHYALASIFEVLDVMARSDLKTDVLKDLERQRQHFGSYRDNPDISQTALAGLLARLEQCFAALQAQSGKTGQWLTDNEWLMGIRNRMGIPGGTCGFDIPSYHAWLHSPPPQRQHDLRGWAGHMEPLADAVYLLLHLLRNGGAAQQEQAEDGLFQKNLPPNTTFQLLRLALDSALPLVPEISANRLMVSVRFMRMEGDGRLVASSDNAAFALTLCA